MNARPPQTEIELSPWMVALTEFLPPFEHWPDIVRTPSWLQYPASLNATAELVDRQVAAGLADRVVFYAGEVQLSFRQLQDRVNRTGNALLGLGIQPGDRVMLHLLDGFELVSCMLAAAKIGAIAVPTFTLFRASDLAYRENDAEAVAIIADGQFADEIEKAATDFRFVRHYLQTGQARDGWRDLQTLVAGASPRLEPAASRRDDPALLLYTSGSTGIPKGCIISHADLLAAADTFGCCLGLRDGDVLGGQPPLAFSKGAGFFLSVPLRLGVPAVLLEQKRPELVLEAIDRYRITVLAGVPTFYNQLIRAREGGHQYDLSALRQLRCAGEPYPPRLQATAEACFGLPVVNGLGATETLFYVASYLPGESLRGDSFGRAVPGYELAVRDPATFQEVSAGESGVLTLRGPSGTRYWRKPEQQAACVRDGWTILPDLVHRDLEGYFFYEARTDEVIVSGGYNIAPVQVEEVVGRHPEVAEVAVIGAPDPDGARAVVVKACVVLRDGRAASDQLARDIQAFVKANAAPYLYPRQVAFFEALPKTPSGKLQRAELCRREQAKKV